MSINFPDPKYVRSNGIRLAYYEMGEGFPIVLCHGFPELAFSWHKVMPALAAAGFRAIAVDQRGYGNSQAPMRTEDYAITELTADIAGLLDALGIEKAVYVGHDWGAPVVWNSALLHPNKVAGVIGVNNPHTPGMPMDPLDMLRNTFGDAHYMVNFHNKGPDNPESSDVLYNGNVEQVFKGLYRTGLFKMADFADLPKEQQVMQMDPIVTNPDPQGNLVLDDEELAHFVNAFSRTGFTPGINWYRNISRNWRATKDLNPHLPMPCLMIEVSDDPSGPPGCTEQMRPYIADLEADVIRDCGHWTGHEKPEELTRIMVDWLSRRFS